MSITSLRDGPVVTTFSLALCAVAWIGVPTQAGEGAPSPRAEMAAPGYMESAVDPGSGAPFTKVTEPGRKIAALPCGPSYCIHRYSLSQAWNADQSLLLIRNGCGGYCFLDGQSFAPKFRRTRKAECEWSPRDAESMVCVGDDRVTIWRPRTDKEVEALRAPELGVLSFGLHKGNLSQDGARLAVVSTRAGRASVFGFDLTTRRRYPAIDLAALPGRTTSCSASASGRYIYCGQDVDGRLTGYVFTFEGELTQHWPENHRPGHGDFALDADGEDIYVGVSKAAPDRGQVIKRRLSDGRVTPLIGPGHAQHVSARNIDRPGWVIVTYSGSIDEIRKAGVPPFFQEVIALRLDGGGEWRPIAQTRTVRHDYRSEAHASPSPDGAQVIWASNWGLPGGPVAAYVSKVDWSAPAHVTSPGRVTTGSFR